MTVLNFNLFITFNYSFALLFSKSNVQTHLSKSHWCLQTQEWWLSFFVFFFLAILSRTIISDCFSIQSGRRAVYRRLWLFFFPPKWNLVIARIADKNQNWKFSFLPFNWVVSFAKQSLFMDFYCIFPHPTALVSLGQSHSMYGGH